MYKVLSFWLTLVLIFIPFVAYSTPTIKQSPVCFSRADYARIAKMRARCESYKKTCEVEKKSIQKKERIQAKLLVKLTTAGFKPRLDACDQLMKSKSNERVWKGVAIASIVTVSILTIGIVVIASTR